MQRKSTPHDSALHARELADLARLADGSLPAERRHEVEARIAAAPGGPELLAGERRAVEASRAVARVRAPDSLRAFLSAQQVSMGPAPRPRRAAFAGGLAAGLAVLVLALVLVLPGGAPGSPSVSQAASLAARGPTGPAPPARQGHATLLARDVDEIYFPNWTRIGWRATGERVDRLDGHLLDTIYYRGYGQRLAYTIVGGPALAEPAHAVLTVRDRTALRSLVSRHHAIVTWRRDGHTCILSGARVPDRDLLRLAARER